MGASMKRIVALLLAVGLASSANAAEPTTGYYGLALGSLTYRERDDPGALVFEDTASFYRLVAGYQFSDHFAVEGGWGKTGQLKDSVDALVSGVGLVTFDLRGKYQVTSIRGIGILPFKQASLFGGVGYANTKFKGTVSVTGFGEFSNNSTDGGWTAVAGVQRDWDRFALRGEYEWFSLQNDVDARDATIGFIYKF
jgi:opacity protein-like surface antigen